MRKQFRRPVGAILRRGIEGSACPSRIASLFPLSGGDGARQIVQTFTFVHQGANQPIHKPARHREQPACSAPSGRALLVLLNRTTEATVPLEVRPELFGAQGLPAEAN